MKPVEEDKLADRREQRSLKALNAVIWSGRSLFCSVLRLIDKRSPLASKWAVRDVV